MNEKETLKMDKQKFIDGIIAILTVIADNLLRYAIAWSAYLFLRSVFAQLPKLGFIKFILVAFAIEVIVSMLFDKSDDEKE